MKPARKVSKPPRAEPTNPAKPLVTPAPQGKAGRPSDYSDETADAICLMLTEGQSLIEICKLPGMPDRRTVQRWVIANAGFAAKCAHAREAQADYEHDKIAEIERRTLAGEIPADVARVVISSKQWRASKLSRGMYGEKAETKVDLSVSWASIVLGAHARDSEPSEPLTIEGDKAD